MANTDTSSAINSTLGYAGKGAAIGSIIPGFGTLAGFGIGAAYGGLKNLFGKKAFNVGDYVKANANGGYVTIPKMGIPGHPEWKPGTRQWLPPGSPIPDESGRFADGAFGSGSSGSSTGAGGITGGLSVNENALRERAIAPTRGLFEAGKRNLERQKALQGGYAPGYGAQMLALSRGQSQAASDAALSAENAINEQKMGITGLKLQEQGMNNDVMLRNKALGLQEKAMPSALDKGIGTASNLMGVIGQGAGAASGIWDYFKGKGGSSSAGSVGDWNTGVYS